MITFEPFREIIRQRKITTYYLRFKCGENCIDHKTIGRLMTDQSVSTNTINALCNIFGCEPGDLMEYAPERE